MKESHGIELTVKAVGPSKVKHPARPVGRILGTLTLNVLQSNTTSLCSRTSSLKGALAAALTSTTKVEIRPTQVKRFVLSGCLPTESLQSGRRMLVYTLVLDSVATADAVREMIHQRVDQFVSSFTSSVHALTGLQLADVVSDGPQVFIGKPSLFAS